MRASDHEDDRQILQAIASGEMVTQRSLSGEMGVALGLTNLADRAAGQFAAGARWRARRPRVKRLAVRVCLVTLDGARGRGQLAQHSTHQGTGRAMLRVTAAVPSSAVDRTEKATITSAADGSAAFDVHIRAVAGPDNPPFGFVDAPSDPVTLGRDPILFQGGRWMTSG